MIKSKIIMKKECIIDGCCKMSIGKGFCGNHYGRLRRYGDPLGVKDGPEVGFWKRVEKGEQCWIWKGRFYGSYGRTTFLGKERSAHRVSFYLHHGKWPDQWCLHKCDTPSCVNPDHLYDGSARDNMRDRTLRGRYNRLNKPDVILKIKELLLKGVVSRKIAKDLGISEATVSHVKKGRQARYYGPVLSTYNSAYTQDIAINLDGHPLKA